MRYKALQVTTNGTIARFVYLSLTKLLSLLYFNFNESRSCSPLRLDSLKLFETLPA